MRKIAVSIAILLGSFGLHAQDAGVQKWSSWGPLSQNQTNATVSMTVLFGNNGAAYMTPMGQTVTDPMKYQISTLRLTNVTYVETNITGYNLSTGNLALYFDTTHPTTNTVIYTQKAPIPPQTFVEITITGKITATASPAQQYGMNSNITPPTFTVGSSNTTGDDNVNDYNSPTGVLPVHLEKFYGNLEGVVAHLKWDVSNEDQFSHYELERSFDGGHFTKVANVEAKGQRHYGYDDNLEGIKGKVYYRLKMVDLNGSYVYSNVVNFIINGISIDQMWPNPAKEQVHIKLTTQEEGKAQIMFFDVTGKAVITAEKQLVKGINTVDITNLGNLARGIYSVVVKQGDKQFRENLSLQ